MNGVAVAPHGLILSQGEATTSRNLSKYLPAPREAIFCPKRTKVTKKQKKQNRKYQGSAAWAEPLNAPRQWLSHAIEACRITPDVAATPCKPQRQAERHALDAQQGSVRLHD